MERGIELASRLPSVVTQDKYSAEGQFLHSSKSQSSKRVLEKPVSKEDFQQGLLKAGLDPTKMPQLARLQGLFGEDWMKEQGYRSVLELARDFESHELEGMFGTLATFAQKHQKNPRRLGLARDGLRDVAFPKTITQGSKRNCGAIACQQVWAQEEPASYLRALTTLASGRAHTFDNGKQLPPLNAALGDPGDDRAGSVKVMGDALARYIHTQSTPRQTFLAVKNNTFLKTIPTGLENYDPICQDAGCHAPTELTTVLKDITGADYGVQLTKPWSQVRRDTRNGHFVPTLIAGGGGMHWINTTDVSSRGKVDVTTWGKDYSPNMHEMEPFTQAFLVRH